MPALKALCVLWLCALLPTRECFQTNLTENIAVQEGHVLTLKCVGSAAEKADVQWLNPRGFVVFFNNQTVLKDRRYKLAHYSEEELSVTLSNITLGDEGLYTCFYYSRTLRMRKVNVTVLAAPSQPTTETRVHESEEKMTMSCFTWGSKPPPIITWRIGNSIEAYGDTTHAFEHDGKKCNTTSTLTLRAATDKSTVECVIRHEALGLGILTASIDLTPISRELIEMNTAATTHILNATERKQIEINTAATMLVLNVSTREHIEMNTAATTLILNATVSESTRETYTDFLNATTTFQWKKTHTEETTFINRSLISLQSTQEQSHTFGNATPTMQWPTTNTEGRTSNNLSVILRGTSPTELKTTSEQTKSTVMYTTDGTKNGILMVTLVVFLIFSLLFIIQLFMLKLRKAHQTWKKEKEASDQTVESNKSRSSNEENQRQNANIRVPNCQSAICYVNECSGPLPGNLQEAVYPPKCKAQDQVAETTL